MPRGQYYGPFVGGSIGRCHPGYTFCTDFIRGNQKAVYACGKMYFASGADYAFADCADYLWQSVGADMGMRVDENLRRCAVSYKKPEDFFYRASFFTPGI